MKRIDLHRIYFLGNSSSILFVKLVSISVLSFCYVFIHKMATKRATLSSGSLQAFINELKEVSLEFWILKIYLKFIWNIFL